MIKQGQCVCVRLSESHYRSFINLQLYVTHWLFIVAPQNIFLMST